MSFQKVILRSFLLTAALLLANPARAQQAVNLYVGDGPIHYSLETNDVVPDSLVSDTNWHLLIDGVDIRPNGEGALLETAYDEVPEAPAEGMGEEAFLSQTGQRWYHYDQDSHFIFAVPGRTMVAHLKDDTYAKIQIQSYYNVETDEPRYLSFRFTRTAPGTRTF